jgi:fructokinase
MTAETKTIVGLGELLWDLLPEGERLGGAPANFAVMASRLGGQGVVASRLGSDDLGEKALEHLAHFPADTSLIQRDHRATTGTVGVEFTNGEPHYLIHQPAAWDFLELSPEWHMLASEADAVCFGTLGQRHPVARKTILQFLAATRPDCTRVFDVNLRPPFFSGTLIAASLAEATIFKLNEAEMPEVLRLLGNDTPLPHGVESLLTGAHWLLERYPMKLVVITMGGDGSLLVTHEAFHRREGIHGPVADTVGAGDAFTAALTHYWLQGASLARMNEAGNRWGGWIASQQGAMPQLDHEVYAKITQQVEAVE